MYLARVQNQLATMSLTRLGATIWCCVVDAGDSGVTESTRISANSKQFAHRGSFSPLVARLGNPEDTH